MNVNTSESSESEIESFENLKYGIAGNNILLDDSCDPDVNFFNVNFENLNTPYLFPEDFSSAFENELSSNYFQSCISTLGALRKTLKTLKCS